MSDKARVSLLRLVAAGGCLHNPSSGCVPVMTSADYQALPEIVSAGWALHGGYGEATAMTNTKKLKLTDAQIVIEMMEYVRTFARFGVKVTGCRPEGCPHDRGHKTIAAYRKCRETIFPWRRS